MNNLRVKIFNLNKFKKMKKEKHKKNVEKITREDLLGFGTEAFSLNQAEYVSKKIIDEILFHTFETIRIHNVKQMNIDYSVYRNFINLQMIVNLGLIKSEKEVELIKKNDFTFDVNPCKIDAWASGRAKIITSSKPKEQISPSIPKPDKNNESSKAKKKEKEKDKVENTMYRSRKNIDMKKLVKEQPPKELPMDFIRPIEEKKETKTFDYDEMKLKGYRAYFQEKQIETQKRKQLEKEQAERAKEEEKKLKQVKDLMNAGKLVSWDANGTFLPLKYVKDTELKNPPQPRQKIMDTKTIYDQDKIFDLDEEGNPKKKKILDISKDKIPIVPKIENYYQPNPLVSHNIQQGVVLEFYGHKKSGGKYDVGGGRLTMDQYHQLLEQINPYENANIEERVDESSGGEESEKKEEEKMQGEGEIEGEEKKGEKILGKKKKGLSGSKKLYFLFRDELKAEEENKKKKKNQENIIKKKKRSKPKKPKAQIDKIELKNFNFKEIKNTQDKSIYNELKEKLDEGYQDFYNEKKILIRMPADLHTKDEISKRTREKKVILDESSTLNQQLPNTIRRTLTKIKEESEQNEQVNKKSKFILPPITARPKTGNISNKNKKKEIEKEKENVKEKQKEKEKEKQ